MDQIDLLVKRCADQVAAAIVFKQLSCSEDKNLSPWDKSDQRLFWHPLLRRVAKQIVLPRFRLRYQPKDELDERVGECVEAILKGSSAGFSYRRLSEAITFFTEAYRLYLLQQLRNNNEHQTVGTPQESPMAEKEQAEHRQEQGRQVWLDPSLSKGHPHPSKRPQSQTLQVLEDALESEQHAAEDRDHLQRSAWQSWNAIVERLKSRTEAIKYSVIYRLRERHRKTSSEIAPLVLERRCGILDEDDLPPSVTWEEVQQVFQEMANRSPVNTVTADALRQCYSRAKGVLKRTFEATKEGEDESAL